MAHGDCGPNPDCRVTPLQPGSTTKAVRRVILASLLLITWETVGKTRAETFSTLEQDVARFFFLTVLFFSFLFLFDGMGVGQLKGPKSAVLGQCIVGRALCCATMPRLRVAFLHLLPRTWEAFSSVAPRGYSAVREAEANMLRKP